MAPAWWWPEGSLAAALQVAAELRAAADQNRTGFGALATADRTEGGASPDRLSIEVCTSSGRAVPVEFRVRLDTVEVSWSGKLCAVFDRDELRGWLSAPAGSFAVDEVRFGLDWMIDTEGRVTISLPPADVHAWALSPGDRAALSERV